MTRYIKMRLCNAYSNLPPREKWLWSEYKRVRSEWMRLRNIMDSLPREKPRFRWDREEMRWRPTEDCSRLAHYMKQEHKLRYRLTELAHYLHKSGYIAPDFNKDQLREL